MKVVIYKSLIIVALFTGITVIEQSYAWRSWYRNTNDVELQLNVFNKDGILCAKHFLAPYQKVAKIDAGPDRFACTAPLQKIDVYAHENGKRTFYKTITGSEITSNPVSIL